MVENKKKQNNINKSVNLFRKQVGDLSVERVQGVFQPEDRDEPIHYDNIYVYRGRFPAIKIKADLVTPALLEGMNEAANIEVVPQ